MKFTTVKLLLRRQNLFQQDVLLNVFFVRAAHFKCKRWFRYFSLRGKGCKNGRENFTQKNTRRGNGYCRRLFVNSNNRWCYVSQLSSSELRLDILDAAMEFLLCGVVDR